MKLATEIGNEQLKRIARERFNAFVANARSPFVAATTHELDWFELEGYEIFATLLIDFDGDYSGFVFAPDLVGRYRCVGWTRATTSEAIAREELSQQVVAVSSNFNLVRVQHDETGGPVDFFKPVVKEKKLHERFKHLVDGRGLVAAKSLIEVLMRWYEDQDGNYIEQFQSVGFDARLWELYLYVTFIEAGYKISNPGHAPDFALESLTTKFTVEAVTINPSNQGGKVVAEALPSVPEELGEFADNYLPIRFAGPLTTKLGKHYWKYPHVAGKPFVLAIQDFHADMSMTYSSDALPKYLYGVSKGSQNEAGAAVLRPGTNNQLKWKNKEIPSGFFTLPDAEHVSAVISNATGTLSKFNRKGIQAGFGVDDVVVRHVQVRVNHGSEAGVDLHSGVVSELDKETWVDGMSVYHNPNALHPLSMDELHGARHVWVDDDGVLQQKVPDGYLLQSSTAVVIVEG